MGVFLSFFVCISSNKQMPKQTAVKGNFVLPYDDIIIRVLLNKQKGEPSSGSKLELESF